MSVIYENTVVGLEEVQNSRNKLTASRRPFFASKLHKFKKMLKPILKYLSHRPAATSIITPEPTIEDLQNAMNEALESRLAEDIATSAGVKGDAIEAMVEEKLSFIIVTRDSCVAIPAHFIATSSGGFSWTSPSADRDICSRDVQTMSFYQEPQQQTPVPSQ